MTYAIIQHGHAVFGTGETLFDAVEDAKSNDLDCDYDEIEMLEIVRSPVDGSVYWTCLQETISDYE